MSEPKVINKLPVNLSNQLFTDLAYVFEEELKLVKEELIDPLFLVFDVKNQIDEDMLVNINSMFGNYTDRSIDDSITFFQDDILAIPFKIKNKTTYSAYNYIFKLLRKYGFVYNLYYDGEKLVKAIDIEDIESKLLTEDLAKPFLYPYPELNFANALNQEVTLDAGLILDAEIPWFLDTSLEKRLTKHLSVELLCNDLFDIDGTKYLMYNPYLDFVNNNAEFNKRAVDVLNIGCNLTLITDKSGYFDNISNSAYSIDDLELNVATTVFFNGLPDTPNILLDDGRTLDEETLWTLDAQTTSEDSRNILEIFYNIVAGKGTQGLLSKTLPDIEEDIILYFPFNEESGAEIQDRSTNNRDGTVYGDYERVKGIISTCIFYNGTNVYCEANNIVINNTNKQINFWIKANTDDFIDTNCYIFNFDGFLDMYYDTVNEELNYTITDGSNTVNNTYSIVLSEDDPKYISLQIDRDNDTLKLFVDCIEENSDDISSIGDFGDTYSLYIGSDLGSDNFWYNLIDEFRVYTRVLTNAELCYLYDNRLGNRDKLDDLVYKGKISYSEIYENTDYYIINTHIPGNTYKGEILATSDGSTEQYTGTFNGEDNYTVKKGSVNIEYLLSDGKHYVKDDNAGMLYSDTGLVSGTINYSTREYVLNFYKDLFHAETIATGSQSIISGFTTYDNILLPDSLSCWIEFYIGDVQYIVYANTSGIFDDDSINTGSITKETGAYSIDFNGTTDADKDIKIFYTYREVDIPNNNTNITLEYSTNENIDYTEIGIEDINGNLQTYSTFPPLNLGTNEYHVSPLFIIKKNT